MDKNERVMFSTDGKGNWWKTEWPLQCEERIILNQCQGVKGHSGEHWAFKPNGSYTWAINIDEVVDPQVVCGTTPPGHKRYKSPIEMHKFYYMYNGETVEIKDFELINRLENGDIPDGASLNTPIEWERDENQPKE